MNLPLKMKKKNEFIFYFCEINPNQLLVGYEFIIALKQFWK